jgi:hypothetical protein
MCAQCIGRDPAATETRFRTSIASQGGQVIGPYRDILTPVACLCAEGHQCSPWPSSIQQGRHMCPKCAARAGTRRRSCAAEQAFRNAVVVAGGRVVAEYVKAVLPVECICPNGHTCWPRPNHVLEGVGMCMTCSGKCPVVAKEAFHALIAEMGGAVIGEYVNAGTPTECLCPEGHVWWPTPDRLKQRGNPCRSCIGCASDVFYVVANPGLRRIKFGITSGDERARLSDHRRAGYADVVRVVPGLDDALILERHVVASLRDAGIRPAQGREYFDLVALAVVLDVVDGWAAA